MKKLISSVVVCSLAVCALASCGSKGDELVGKWSMKNLTANGIDDGGIIFTADGKGAIYEDTSSVFYFEDNGINFNGTTVSSEYITDSNDVVSVNIQGQELLTMKRMESKGTYYGTYTLTGGVLYDSIVKGMESRSNKKADDLNVTIDFSENHSEVLFNDLFTYKVKGSTIEVSGFSGLFSSKSEKASAKFKIDGDTLTIKDSNSEETLTRVK
ncbi:LptM family lipoprotein [Ruminococcus flavefaciens]|uniref:Lipocalin-like domain-containing protein n=1 Tax=Ruminococcus flavefaciens 007c TaxID=1341157 RepID=W7UFH9_RUMFL|nr:hypothetical protein [Ruminococcus flavefaciens]EWM52653.1 hypothetical protein RF007C_00710 [Ruminococcus flavefaciens 007c]